MEVSIAEIAEIIEAVQAVQEVVDVINENTDESETLSQDLLDVLDTFTDGEEGNNDVEAILGEIRDALYGYGDEGKEITVMSDLIRTRNELIEIDARLDAEFTALNNTFSLLLGGVAFFIIWTLLTFVFNRIKNV